MVSPQINNEVLKIRSVDEYSEDINISYETLRRSVMILRAINHKLRQDIIKLLEEHGQMTVTEIYVKLRVEQSVASQHLAILRRAGILITERDGKFIIYSLNRRRLQEITDFMEDIVNTEA
jgi:DNA-binding transcriptional ArsR family regulator